MSWITLLVDMAGIVEKKAKLGKIEKIQVRPNFGEKNRKNTENSEKYSGK